MSELIETGAANRKDVLKHLILQLHAGETAPMVQRQLLRLLGQVPYGLVVEVEQELIEDGMPLEAILNARGRGARGSQSPRASRRSSG